MANNSRSKLEQRWRTFERDLRAKDLGWALHYAPRDLRYARRSAHPRGVDLEHLLPEEYKAFVAAVGYPVVGFSYNDAEGLSLLPPEAMGTTSVGLFIDGDELPKGNTSAPSRCKHAFFAGTDLADIHGYSFGPSAEDEDTLVVWLVESAGPVEEVGAFSEWMTGEIERLHEKVSAATPEDVAAWLQENEGETDPHRLIDYSLDKSYDIAPYTKADLALTWVERQVGNPYDYGLIDDQGVWRIPMGKRFTAVRPFRSGKAEVMLSAEDPGEWTRIGPDGV